MSAARVARGHVATLAADVVGYSRLLGRDEAGTLAGSFHDGFEIGHECVERNVCGRAANGSLVTRRWREMDSNFRFRCVRRS